MEEYNKGDIVIAKCGHITYIGKYLEKLTDIYRLTDWIPISRITDSKIEMVGGFNSIVRKATKEEINQYLGVKEEKMETIPEKWAVRLTKEVKDWIKKEFDNDSYDCEKETAFFNFPNYHNGKGFSNRSHSSSKAPFSTDYTEISLEQFKKHILKEKEMNKKIIGYKAPIDLYGGEVKKNTIYVASFNKNYYEPEDRKKDSDSITLPKEIVEQWEAVYENEFKVGDVLYVEKYIESASQSGDLIEITTIIPNSTFEYWFSYKNLKTGHTGGFGKSHYMESKSFRLATPEEIAKAKEKVVNVGGKFDVTIKNGGIYHKSENILSYVKKVVEWWQNNKNQKLAGYDFNLEDVIVKKSGCEGTIVRVSHWLEVYEEYQKSL